MPQFQENVRLSDFSNYKIGGPARFFFEARNEAEVAWAVREAQSKNLPIFILGGGTNILINDEGFHGLVLIPRLDFVQGDSKGLYVGAGTSIATLLDYSIANSLSGLEWAGGLPGTLGGAIRGNAGCFGGEMKDVIQSVRSLNVETMSATEHTNAECAFGYRDSMFKKSGSEIILSAVVQFKKGESATIQKAIAEKQAYRNERHPLEYPNIGSMFKNVPLDVVCEKESEEYEKAVQDGKFAYQGSEFTVKTDPFPVISAAKLISESGVRGAVSGGAMISEKHPNFIVNMGGATAADVKNLIALMKAAVAEKFSITLEEEPEIL